MIDVVDKVTRSKMMSGIKSRNTKPEMIVRGFIHNNGLRFRLHQRNLAGSPDLVLNKYKIAIFVHGCFWHRHELCAYSTTPASRIEFWKDKFEKNVLRDKRNVASLIEDGWRVLIIWECGVKHCLADLPEILVVIRSDELFTVWPDRPPRFLVFSKDDEI
ncbi:very short patch repair endonuclease [Pseudomonas viridiflava]